MVGSVMHRGEESILSREVQGCYAKDVHLLRANENVYELNSDGL